ncbi:putative RNA methyltransferase [Paenibacillus oryzisoli]|uniref:putative RNA methyltransferase n=1 Tax=Paenibacillus oryzisoli TaxID=1850517 RepID=UPI003D2992C0
MLKKDKKTIAAEIMDSHSSIFRCPICASPMNVFNLQSLLCENKHCFDISKVGYVNLLSHPVTTKYDKRLFDSRKIINQSGFFKPVSVYISQQISETLEESNEVKVLDAGCGEGSLLSCIRQILKHETKKDVLGVGLDISKEGITTASKSNCNSIWCVADLARCPLADNQFHSIINILAPSNYSEFQRLLASDGKVIKVVPEQGYLKELRSLYDKRTGQQTNSSCGARDAFGRYFKVQESQRLQYTVTLDHSLIQHLVNMTPLSWGAKAKHIQKVLGMTAMEITIDLTILIGKKH